MSHLQKEIVSINCYFNTLKLKLIKYTPNLSITTAYTLIV